MKIEINSFDELREFIRIMNSDKDEIIKEATKDLNTEARRLNDATLKQTEEKK
jgi:hypothetical protein